MKNNLLHFKALVRHYRTSKFSHLAVNSFLHQVIIGIVLGDLHVEKPSTKHNARLQFKQSSVNMPYVEHIYALLKDFCSSPPVGLSYFDERPNKLKKYSSSKVQTASIPCFNIYRELFYDEAGLKRLPNNLGDMLTSVSLAYWFIDDGYKSNKGYYFCTESFSDQDITILLNLLTHKFNLNCSVHKTTNGPRIYIKSSSVDLFNKLIKPYIIEHFTYKLHKSPIVKLYI